MSIENSNFRSKFTRVKTAKGRKSSSTNWLKRQLNDQYVMRSKIDGYRSRAAYKIIEINDKFKLFKSGDNIIDLGAAPGGWSQIAAKLCKSDITDAKNTVIAIDLLEIEPIAGVQSFVADFYLPETKDLILNEIKARGIKTGLVDNVISDMAGNTTGHAPTDHLRIIDLCENAFYFGLSILKPGGNFVAKVFRGGAENELLSIAKQNFTKVKHFKPKSSRKESSEFYLIALGKKDKVSD